MSDIQDLKLAKQKAKGDIITEADYKLRDKKDSKDSANTIDMKDNSKYTKEIEAAKKAMRDSDREAMKAELLAEIRAEMKAEAKGAK